MRRIHKYGIGLLLFVLLVSAKEITVSSQTETKWLAVTAVTQSKNSIKLSWKKKAVSQYRIYRAPMKKDGEPGKFKKIATISGKKKSYTNKVPYKKNYEYRVMGYKKKGKKYVKTYSGEAFAYSGMGACSWKEYQRSDALVTPKSIPLEVYLDYGFTPTAYEIYRSTDGKKYKKLAAVKKKTVYLKYVDKKVKKGQSYYYKVRAYRTLKGKKYYGKYTSALKLAAVNAIGRYKVQVLTQEGDLTPVLTVCLTSNKDNADLIFNKNTNNYLSLYYKKNGSYFSEEFLLSKYSYDNKTWYQAGKKKAVIKQGQSIYLQFATSSGKDFAYQVTDMQSADLDSVAVEYNELLCELKIDLKKRTAESRVNGEFYH